MTNSYWFTPIEDSSSSYCSGFILDVWSSKFVEEIILFVDILNEIINYNSFIEMMANLVNKV